MKVNRHIKIIMMVVLGGFLLAASWNFASGRGLKASWERGEVTKAPWSDPSKNLHIEVDGYTYTFVSPNVRLERHVRTSANEWYVRGLTMPEIRTGDQVLIRVAGPHIYYFVLEEK
ncbi:MAG: hypothetical protein JW836_03430 [Deltaproteobacteria bacterium]|nr:hypothetical protein [Deltaproteobacteria bacterium]